ncbi:MAG TPA: oligosaccharide flippase family protein [bacterium]|nr:oligosaccharide flippase family protein [bacterium]HPO08976.1 oligosaccharide flippase family protein [bacterium]HQO35558.1 oligosaccharide flippase family protein [bacterium]HQP98690.1 oligosaccharide flippase family protein [bacterium]
MVQSLQRDVLQTLGTRIIAALSMIVAEICVSRMLGPDGRGSFALFLSSLAQIEPLCSMGFPIALIHVVACGTYPPSLMAGWAVLGGLVQGLIGCAFFYVLAVVIQPGFLDGLSPLAPLWMFLCLPCFLISQHLGNVILGLRDPRLYNAFFVLQRAIFCLLAFGLYWSGQGTVDRVVGLYSLSMVPGVVVGIVYTYKKVGFSFHFRGSGQAMKDLYQSGVVAQFSNIFARFALWSDTFIVNGFLGANQLGYYSIAKTAAQVIFHIPFSVGRVLLPRVSHDPQQRSPESTARVCRILMTIQIVVGILVGVAASVVIGVFLPKFLPAIPVLFILLPGTIGYGVFQVLELDVFGRKKSLLSAAFNALLLTLTLLGNLCLIPILGLYGGACGTTLAYLCAGMVLVKIYGALYKVSPWSLLLPERIRFSELRDRFLGRQ